MIRLYAGFQAWRELRVGDGMVVLGIASVIIGEALVGSRAVGLLITGTVIGSVLFRLLVAITLRWGLNPNDLKLMTALFVFAARATGWRRRGDVACQLHLK
jgi:putative tryptophan/tyrosine transport system permease protein